MELKLGDFIEALRKRGQLSEASDYEAKFMGIFCPPLDREHLLNIPFNDLCAATKMLNEMNPFSPAEPRVFSMKTGKLVSSTDGVEYLKRVGKWHPTP